MSFISETRGRVRLLILALPLVLASSALAQTPTESDRARESALRMVHAREIPEATLPCTPEEAKWWHELRTAAKAVEETRGGKKEKQKYFALLLEGQNKSYQPPIPDLPAIVLRRLPPSYSEAGRRKQITGSIALVTELRFDGFVGEVEVVKGLERGLDQNAVEAAHETIFLPRIKDRKFVTFRMPMTMSFHVY